MTQPSTPASLVDTPDLPPKVRRTRALLVLVIVASFCLSYLAGWSYWAQTHVVTRHVQVPAGQPASSEEGEFTVLSMVATSELAGNEEEAVEDTVAEPNTVFVIVELEVVLNDSADEGYPNCSLVLVGSEGRIWEYDGLNAPQRKLPSSCTDAPRNEPYTFELIYVVPKKHADQLHGVAIPSYTGAPEEVIRPPAQ